MSLREIANRISKSNHFLRVTKNEDDIVGIKHLKARHDVTKLDLIVSLLSFWCIDIDLSNQPTSLTLYMTCVQYEFHKRYKS